MFEETGAGKKTVLEETGKNLILKRIADKKEDELVLLKSNLKKVGYINEVKSFISEMAQYKVRPEDIENPSEFLLGEIKKVHDILGGNVVKFNGSRKSVKFEIYDE